MAVEKHRVDMWFYDSYFLIGFLPVDFADVFKNIGPRVYPEIMRQAGEIPASFLVAPLDALSLDGDDNDFFVVRIQEEADLGNIAAGGILRCGGKMRSGVFWSNFTGEHMIMVSGSAVQVFGFHSRTI
jgi:hypothetical protein